MSEVSLNGALYDFSVDHNAIEKEEIFNVQKHLMKQNNIRSIKQAFICVIKF